MRRCSNCQKEMPDNSRYCASCGQMLTEGEQTVLIRVVRAKSLRPGTRPRPSTLAGPFEGKGEQKRSEKGRPVPPAFGPVSNRPTPGHMPATQGTPGPGQVSAIADIPTVAHPPVLPDTPSVLLTAPSIAGAPPSTPPPEAFRPVHQPEATRDAASYDSGAGQSGPIHVQPERQGEGAQHLVGQRVGQVGASLSPPERVHAGASTAARAGTGRPLKILMSILVGLVIVAGGVGALVLVRQINSNPPTSVATPPTGDDVTVTPGPSLTPSPTPAPTNVFTVSGALAGSMTVVSFRACGTLGAGYAVFAIVSLNGQQYNLNILFLNYHGAGLYTNTAASDQVNIGLNNGVSGTGARAWNTSQAHNNGSGIINNDGASGSLTGFILYSTVDKGKIQFAGNWRCG